MVYKATPVSVAFWRKVEKRDPSQCWPWMGSRTSQGYGLLCKRRATHIALELSGHPQPVGAIALHRCDNPICVNPHHLRWGTDAENVADMIERRRHQASRKTECIKGHPLSGDNLISRKDGQRGCRACARRIDKAYKERIRSQRHG